MKRTLERFHKIIPKARDMTLPDQLRAVIEESGLSRHRIVKETGIQPANPSDFVWNRMSRLSLANEERMRMFFGLKLVATGTPELETALMQPRNPKACFRPSPTVFAGNGNGRVQHGGSA
ncbi:MAG: hypothetical protein GY778_17515 [bacterium]|nr:hypothetical protein [bacterium]